MPATTGNRRDFPFPQPEKILPANPTALLQMQGSRANARTQLLHLSDAASPRLLAEGRWPRQSTATPGLITVDWVPRPAIMTEAEALAELIEQSSGRPAYLTTYLAEAQEAPSLQHAPGIREFCVQGCLRVSQLLCLKRPPGDT